jgi:AhpD family alkylhydroperoxidase
MATGATGNDGARIVCFEAGAPRPTCAVCDEPVPLRRAAVATARAVFCGACVAAHGRGLRLLSTGCSELDAFVARIGLAAHLELNLALESLDAQTDRESGPRVAHLGGEAERAGV